MGRRPRRGRAQDRDRIAGTLLFRELAWELGREVRLEQNV